jgi:DNA-binding MarR family transcriptional regulator
MEPRWLSDDEQAVWRAFLLTWQLLDEAMDRQLLHESGMPLTYYAILVTLSEAPDHSMRMTDVARALRYSPSRLTHAVASLERDGWVTREPCESDRRGHLAVITPAGIAALEAAAPGHVAEVRSRIFDRLNADQVRQLHDICSVLLEGLEADRSPARA